MKTIKRTMAKKKRPYPKEYHRVTKPYLGAEEEMEMVRVPLGACLTVWINIIKFIISQGQID
jgi:hypothetical protein